MIMASVKVKPINAVTEVADPRYVDQILQVLISRPTPEEIEKSRRCVEYAKNTRRDS
jgi:hypothetical protein